MMSSSSSSCSPCAACKLLRRKCTEDCVFAPYFRADQPQKFANVHKVFGASNIAKLLNDLPVEQREDAVNSLSYEADARLRDPVYGCVGFISILQHKLKQIQLDLFNAKKELSTYIGPSAMLPIILDQQGSTPENYTPQYQQQQQQPQMMRPNYNMQQPQMMMPNNMQQQPQMIRPYYNMQQGQVIGGSGLQQTVANPPSPSPSPLVIQQQQQYQLFMQAQQIAAAVAAAKEEEMLRNYARQAAVAKEQELLRNNDPQEAAIVREQELHRDTLYRHLAAREQENLLRTIHEHQQAAALVQQQVPRSDLLVGYDMTGQGQGQIPSHQMSVSAGMTPTLAFGTFEVPYQIQQHTQDDPYRQHHQLRATQLLLEEQQLQGLALGQPLQLDPQQEELQLQLQLQQHQDGSEEEVGSFGPGSIGPL